MIYALMTLIGILSIGGIIYFVLSEVFLDLYEAMVTLYPTYLLNDSTAFIYDVVLWLPIFILIVGIISAVVIELRRKNADAYFNI